MSRIKSIDLIRTIAIFAVIVIHTTPFDPPQAALGQQLDVATILNQLARFAVPFFFIVSGYFWAAKCYDAPSIRTSAWKIASRIVAIFIVWSAIYLLPTNPIEAMQGGASGLIKTVYWNLGSTLQHPMTTLFQGTKSHLWYLVALICCQAICAFYICLKQPKALVITALLLFVIALLAGPYSPTSFGIHLPFNFRNGPFFGLLLFVTGYFLRQREANPIWVKWGAIIAVLGTALHFAEINVLHQNWGQTLDQDFVAGTYLMGLGVALMGLSNAPSLDIPKLAAVGPFVLGIYVSHFIFVDVLKPLDQRYSDVTAWQIAYPALVFVLSYGLTALLAKQNWAKKYVS